MGGRYTHLDHVVGLKKRLLIEPVGQSYKKNGDSVILQRKRVGIKN